MHKLLIVDDEKLARSDILLKVMKSGFQFEWIMEAEGTQEALEIIMQNKPDIMLTDIKIDEKNGIDLIGESLVFHPKMLSIVISGYADFSYAQESISLNVIAYLLKPIRQEQLNMAMAKASAEIMRTNDKMRLLSRNFQLERYQKNTLLQEEIEAFFNGVESKNASDIAQLLPDDAVYFQIFLFRIDIGRVNEDIYIEEYDLMRFGVRNIVQEIGGNYFITFNSYIEYHHITVLAGSKENCMEAAIDELFAAAGLLVEIIKETLQVSIEAGLSDVGKQLSVSFIQQARQALDLRLCLCNKEDGIYVYGDYANEGENSNLQANLKLYQQYLDSGSLSEVMFIVRNIIKEYEEKPILTLRTVYVEMICILSRFCFKKGADAVSFLGAECFSGAVVDRVSSLEELINHLYDIISTAVNPLIENHSNTGNMLESVRFYIENHFTSSDLSTSVLSKQYNVSLGYLSASFTKKFGITISKYILYLRLEYAKNLLLITNFPIHIVAENSGFNNVGYFTRSFKTQYNYSPARFREKEKATKE